MSTKTPNRNIPTWPHSQESLWLPAARAPTSPVGMPFLEAAARSQNPDLVAAAVAYLLAR